MRYRPDLDSTNKVEAAKRECDAEWEALADVFTRQMARDQDAALREQLRGYKEWLHRQ